MYENKITYSGLTRYAHHIKVLQALSSEVLLLEPMPNFRDVESKKRLFNDKWLYLTSCVVKHHPFDQNKICRLYELLSRYEVEVSEDILEFVDEKIRDVKIYEEMSKSDVIQNIQLSKNFNVSTLYLHEECSLEELIAVCSKFKEFENKFLHDNIKKLVYFNLEESKLFQRYISKQLQLDLSFKNSLYSINSKAAGMAAEDFNQALTTALKSLDNLILGSTTYSEIVSCHEDFMSDNKCLLNEIYVLKRYVVGFEFPSNFRESLANIESMLHLIQWSPYIISLCKILKNFEAFKDIDLAPQALFKIADDMESKKSEMTALQAKELMQDIKIILGITEELDCLKILPAIAQSKEFYTFLYDQKYSGIDGQKRFKQKYDLITAQLQHQAYNDNVLNHLWVAYTLMTPFLEPSSLKELVSEIKKLSKGKDQLMTVNSNLTLICIWFSKAEVRQGVSGMCEL